MKLHDERRMQENVRRDRAIAELTRALRMITQMGAFFGESQAMQAIALQGLEAAGSFVPLPPTS